MNIALENTEEFINGECKNRYGDAFIRGNNGTCLCEVRVPRSYVYDLNLVMYIRAAKAS